MKLNNILKTGLIIIVLWLIPQAVFAEEVSNYQVEINIQPDASLKISELIVYDFGELQRHGIFRSIPYKYKTKTGKFNLRMSEFSVTDQNGRKVPFSKSTSGDDLVLKIGDADIFVTGVNEYKINYTVDRAINYFDDHDELYWNAIGTGWEVPILKSQVLVKAPTKSLQQICYLGRQGSQAQECNTDVGDASTLVFDGKSVLQPGEGFTVVVSLPPGTVAKPSWQDRLWDNIRDNWIVGLPITVFIIMYYLWFKFGRDEQGQGTIVAQYEPPEELSPIYMGTLVDGKLDNKDLSAEIIDLAVKGYLSIEKISAKKLLIFKGSDYVFTKKRNLLETMPELSKQLFNAFFASGDSVKLSEFKTKKTFGKKITEIRKDIFIELTTMGFWKKNPNTLKGIFVGVGVVTAIWVSGFVSSFFGAIGLGSVIASGVIVIIFGLLMPALTKKGALAKEYILGLKEYLTVAEKDRLQFHHAPDKQLLNSPAQFEKLLPYAVALGVEKEWAKQFEGIFTEQPSWYNDSTGTAFNAALLSSSIGDFSSSFQSAVATTTTAAGGGSGFSGGGSGGGGGGGGGGSW